jgi:cyclopropane fatty-acyl-phospholipid synthase-like methyltransferase
MAIDSTSYFPRDFLRQALMGPNALRLLDELAEHFELPPTAHVLDLGCGMGLTSMALAKRFGCTVTAADLWIDAADNQSRFERFKVANRVTAVHCEAHALPFEPETFDAVISIDSYHYYGADSAYLNTHLLPVLKPGGLLAVVVPGLQHDLKAVPAEILPFWQDGMNFYSATWWRQLWLQTTALTITDMFAMRCHAQAWQDWLACDNEYAKSDIPMIKAEQGRYFATLGLMAEKKPNR